MRYIQYVCEEDHPCALYMAIIYRIDAFSPVTHSICPFDVRLDVEWEAAEANATIQQTKRKNNKLVECLWEKIISFFFTHCLYSLFSHRTAIVTKYDTFICEMNGFLFVCRWLSVGLLLFGCLNACIFSKWIDGETALVGKEMCFFFIVSAELRKTRATHTRWSMIRLFYYLFRRSKMTILKCSFDEAKIVFYLKAVAVCLLATFRCEPSYIPISCL